MKHTLRKVFRSGKFVTGFVHLHDDLMLIVILYPAHHRSRRWRSSVRAPSSRPASTSTSMTASGAPHYTLNLDDAAAKRIASKLNDDDRLKP
jgi:hypothetical protein